MALIAVHAVVDIAGYSAVLRVRLRGRVAGRALEDGVVIRIGVASCANAVRVSVVHREPCVIERCAQPVRCDPRRVACGAGGREARGDMVRICRAVVIGLVT